ncbi:hypothetical protein BDBG_04899 [Blastomyces gilchristii SLH14081]|uniref:Uncharacterized protein n=1 Tax=Blastomyces gilchristii (strain SLH14081) TaxID=559298 RepID=A0A179UN46_BLAGS|nr:uncharacterized protein BDBG_04899 [Blastomyces gilchristii SLH14081]OAT08648.1 hypothetical protein BDBG_04899 [Blastomyces gilchristii SLH14081]
MLQSISSAFSALAGVSDRFQSAIIWWLIGARSLLLICLFHAKNSCWQSLYEGTYLSGQELCARAQPAAYSFPSRGPCMSVEYPNNYYSVVGAELLYFPMPC